MGTAPRLTAHFVKDESGKPSLIEAGGRKHYKVTFGVEGVPDAYAATFELHPTYYDPVRSVSPDTDGHLALNTTAYGDYDLKVKVQAKEGVVQIVDSVSDALKRGLGGQTADAAFADALAYIRDH